MASATDGQAGSGATRTDALRALVSSPGAVCPHCAYSLEGLAESDVTPSRCPECGGGFEAGLVRGVGTRRMRRVMLLMFAWLAFAGCMNATRRAIAMHDWYEGQRLNSLPRLRLTQPSLGNAIGVRNLGITPILSPNPTPVPVDWWLELGGWSILGLLGLWGIIATLWLAASVRREKRLVVLLVLGFIAYWGYHGFQFVAEMAARV